MTARKLIGLLVAVLGIALGAFLSGVTAILVAGYWSEPHRTGMEDRPGLIVVSAIGALVGYGIYRAGRYIAR